MLDEEHSCTVAILCSLGQEQNFGLQDEAIHPSSSWDRSPYCAVQFVLLLSSPTAMHPLSIP